MTADHHTPYAEGGPLTAAAMTAPLGELDEAITNALVGSGVVVIVSTGGQMAPTIQAAIDAATGPTVLRFPSESYLFDEQVLIDRDNIFFEGISGASNPASAEGTTNFFVSGDIVGAAFLFDKSPGLSPQPENHTEYVVSGGGMRNINIDGGLTTGDGIGIVSGRNLVFEDMSVSRFLGRNVYTTNHGTAPGGDDAYDANTANRFTGLQSITSTGICVQLDDRTFGMLLDDIHLAATSSGGVCLDLLGCDDIWVDHYSILTQNAGGIGIRLTGADYGGVGKAPSGGSFGQGYINGSGTAIRAIGDGFDISPRRNLFLGVGTEDVGELVIVADSGAMPSLLDTEGRHNLRSWLKGTALVYDDFIAGAVASPNAGQLGWGVSGTVTYITAVASHPGILRAATGASAGTLASLHLRTAGGLLLPSDDFIAEFIFRTNQAGADGDVQYRVGLTSDPTATVTGPANGIYIEKLYADTAWRAVTRASASQTRSSALDTVVATGWVRLTISRHNSTTIAFTIGDSINGNSDARITATIPTAALIPFFSVLNQSAVDKSIEADAFQLLMPRLDR